MNAWQGLGDAREHKDDIALLITMLRGEVPNRTVPD